MTRDELIERARQLIDDEVLTRTGRSVGDLASGHVARALADEGLLADPSRVRPMVLLRANDCDCTPPYADCPHGPEPVDALDLAVWLHAEAKHQHAELLAQRDCWWDHVNGERDALQARVAELEESVGHHTTMRGDAVAQREMLKTRIDAALAVCDEYPAGWNAPTLAHDRVRAALQGDQPAKPEPLPEVELIAAERRRVLTEEGRTPEGDDGYEFGQLLYAAAAYIGANVGSPQILHPGQLWPWEFRYFKPRDLITNLVKAGQLIAAEIARLQRVTPAESTGEADRG